jgi:hypothetical protein
MSARLAEHIRSNVVTYLVLFLAVTVVPAYAAGLKKNSVTSKQIKDGQVKAVDADPTQLQLRVGSACAAGGSIRAINQDGTVTCETDDVGSGGGSPTGAAGGDLAGTYPNPEIAALAVGIAELSDGAVVTSKIADAQVTIAKLAFDPATQAEFDAVAAAGTINQGSNPVDWTKLKNVPAVFADGTDDSGQPTGTAGGDLSGTYPNPDVAANAVALTTDTTGSYVGTVTTNDGLTGGAAGSEGSALTLGLDYGSGLGTSNTLGANESSFAFNGLLFEGAIDDANQLLVAPANPAADTTITLPAETGTVALREASQTFTGGTNTFNDNVTLGSAAGDVIGINGTTTFTSPVNATFTNAQRMTLAQIAGDGTDSRALEVDFVNNNPGGDDAAVSLRNEFSSTEPLDAMLQLDNRDDEAGDGVVDGLRIEGLSTDTITTAIDVADAAVGTAIDIGNNNIISNGTIISPSELNLVDGGISGADITDGSVAAGDLASLTSLALTPQATAPVACTVPNTGVMYYDSNEAIPGPAYCNGTSYVMIYDGATAPVN